MIKEFCDVCGREIDSYEDHGTYKIKIKERSFLWTESWWEKISICNDCKKSFYSLHKKLKERKNNEL